jgi:D-arabinose 1-dehydrogenase-like Zn-dependent alcohol dehydrogenase
MCSVQVSKPNVPLELAELDVPEPNVRQVGIKVQACGICYSDSLPREIHLAVRDLI